MIHNKTKQAKRRKIKWQSLPEEGGAVKTFSPKPTLPNYFSWNRQQFQDDKTLNLFSPFLRGHAHQHTYYDIFSTLTEQGKKSPP
jgi:hypothetical protein